MRTRQIQWYHATTHDSCGMVDMDTDTRAARLARDIDAALAALTTTLRTDRDAILARVALGLATVADVAMLAQFGLDARTYAPPPEDPTGPHGG